MTKVGVWAIAAATMAAMVGVVSAGCGGSGAGTTTSMGTGGEGGSPTIDSACAEIAKARCEKLDSCSDDYLVKVRYGDVATCEDRVAANCRSSLAADGTGNSASADEACAQSYAGEACVDLENDKLTTACRTKAGALADGAACAFSAQCASAFCLTQDAQPCGTCAPAPKDGDPCTTTAQCGPNQGCASYSGQCTTFAAIGEACGLGKLCGAGASCVGGSATVTGTCRAAMAKAGDACDSTLEAASGCDANLGLDCDSTSQKCVAISLAEDGQPCGTVSGVTVGCAAGGRCFIVDGSGTGTCKAAAKDGAACDTTNGPGCLLPARCVTKGASTAGTCQLDSAKACTGDAPSDGQACADNAAARCRKIASCSDDFLIHSRFGNVTTCETRLQLACRATLAAAGTGNTAADVEACAPTFAGQTCEDYHDGLFTSACVVKAGAGAAGAGCSYGAQCASTFCLVPEGAACGTCAPIPKDGDACTSGLQCGAGQACSKATSKCATYVSLGAACGLGVPCAIGLTCVGATATAMGTCAASVTTEGAPCALLPKDGPDCDRALGLYCGPTSKTCTAIRLAGPGKPCGVMGDTFTDCSAGGLCVLGSGMTTGVCKAAVADGQACDDTAGPPCLSPARCIVSGGGTAGVCRFDGSSTCP